MDDDAGMSSKPPTERLDQAQSKLEAAQSELKEAQSKLEAAQSELKEAQNAWLAASDENKGMHESIVQSAKENVQSAKEMRDVFLNAVAEMQGTMSQSGEGRIVEMLENLQPQLENLRRNQENLQPQLENLRRNQENLHPQLENLRRNQENLQPQLENLRRNQENLHPQLERLAQNVALVMEAVLNRYSLTPVSDYSSTTVGGVWHEQATDYYGTSSCLILQNLFPQDFRAQPRWLKETGWDSVFPAVAEHIIPKKGFNFIQNELNIQIDDPRNSLLLLRHLEHTFQDGDWSLIPFAQQNGGVWFRVHVSQDLRSATVKYIDRNSHQEDVVRVHKLRGLQPLMFGDLHLKELLIRPPPFLRALFLKARMAWKKHVADADPLPNPGDFASAFAESCETWDRFMVAKLFSSIEQQNTASGAQSP